MKPRTPPRNRDLAAIHVAKKQLGLDDETYRAMLWTVARVQSAADLDHAGRRAVLEHLHSRGFHRRAAPRPRPAPDLAARVGKVRALWQGLHQVGHVNDPSESALISFVHRQTGVGALQWLTAEQISRVIESLKKWHKRPVKRNEQPVSQ